MADPSPKGGGTAGFGLARGVEDPLRRAEATWQALEGVTQGALDEAEALRAHAARLGEGGTEDRGAARLRRALRALAEAEGRTVLRAARSRTVRLWRIGIARRLAAAAAAASASREARGAGGTARRALGRWEGGLRRVAGDLRRLLRTAVAPLPGVPAPAPRRDRVAEGLDGDGRGGVASPAPRPGAGGTEESGEPDRARAPSEARPVEARGEPRRVEVPGEPGGADPGPAGAPSAAGGPGPGGWEELLERHRAAVAREPWERFLAAVRAGEDDEGGDRGGGDRR